MSTTDTQIREAFLQSCNRSGVNTTTLTVYVFDNVLTVRGIVASEEERYKLWALLETVDRRVTDITSQVRVMPSVGLYGTDASAPLSPKPEHQKGY